MRMPCSSLMSDETVLGSWSLQKPGFFTEAGFLIRTAGCFDTVQQVILSLVILFRLSPDLYFAVRIDFDADQVWLTADGAVFNIALTGPLSQIDRYDNFFAASVTDVGGFVLHHAGLRPMSELDLREGEAPAEPGLPGYFPATRLYSEAHDNPPYTIPQVTSPALRQSGGRISFGRNRVLTLRI